MRFFSSFITLLCLWFLTLPAFCQWTDIASSRLDIKFKDENIGWMTGEGGMLQKTTDGGKTWFNVQTPVEYEEQDITQLFLFGDVLHVVSTNAYPVMQRFSTMYSSTDGGVTWVNDVKRNNGRIGGHFATAMLGWYWDRSEYDYANLAYRTTDGGRNWVEDSDLKEVVAMFTLNNTTWALLTKDAKYQLWKSTDGGVSWTTKNEITPVIDNYNFFTSLQFLDDQNGWMATTYQNEFYKTSDGGVTWQLIRYDNTMFHNNARQVHFINANNGLIITNDGLYDVIFKTTNGGTTWNRVLTTPDPYTVRFEKVYFRDALNGFVLGTSGYTAMTADGGNTWTQTNYCTASTNFEIEGLAYNGQDIWATGRGFLQHSSNGTEWQIDPIGNSFYNEFSRIAFPPAEDGKGVFIGELAYVSTVNNGETWTFNSPQFDYHSDYLHEEVMYDPAGNIWVKNINGPLYKSTDGGLTYKLKYSFPGYLALADYVAFQSEKNIWYYGDTWLLRSKDGGNTWTQTSEAISAMFFLNNYVGWKIRVDGTVYRTIDGAESWQSVSTVSQWPGFKFIHFADEFTGWIVDRYTNVLKTTDGGKTWIKEVVGVYGVTNDAVFRVNEQNKVVGYVGGNRLIRFNSGYTPIPFLNVNAPVPSAATNDLKVSLQWPDNSTGEDGFIIQILSAGNWVELARGPSNQYEATVAAYGNYTFRVGAYKQGRVVAMGEPLIVTVEDPSNLAPVLVTRSPLVSATNVDPASTFKLEFNKDIEVILPADIQINYTSPLGSGTKVISLSASTFSIAGKVLIITPPEPLPYASTITVIVKSTTIKDNQGHFFEGVNDWTFSTKADTESPTVVTLFPANGGTDVDSKTQLKITFDEPIVFQPGKIRLLNNSGNPTDIDLTTQNTSVQNNSATITLQPELMPGTSVSIEIAEGIFTDLAGNKFQLLPSQWTFTTKANITAIENELVSNSMLVNQNGDEIIIQNSNQHFKVEGIFDILGRSVPFTSNTDQVSFRKQQGIILIRYSVNGNFRTEKMLFSSR